jgi:hypothetical protein
MDERAWISSTRWRSVGASKAGRISPVISQITLARSVFVRRNFVTVASPDATNAGAPKLRTHGPDGVRLNPGSEAGRTTITLCPWGTVGTEFRRRTSAGGERLTSIAREPAENMLRLVPATGAKDLEACASEPLLGRGALERYEGSLALSAPRVGARRVRVIAPEEPDAFSAVDGDGNVFTDQANPLVSVKAAGDSGLTLAHDAELPV